MANIKDVAKNAGVALGTVSRFLNGHNVSEQNKEKIVKAIEELDFKVNHFARSMKTGKSMTIAVIVPRLANLFSMRFIEAFEDYLENIGFSVIVCDSKNNGLKELERLKFVTEKRVDGIVLMSVNNSSTEIQNIIKDIPLVLVDRTFNDGNFDNVTVENYKSSYTAVHSYIKKGFKKFGILAGPQNVSTAKQRLRGVLDAITDNDLDIPKEQIIECDYTIVSGLKNIDKLLDSKPEVIFASNNELTLSVIKGLRERNISIGEDIKLIGFDSMDFTEIIPQRMTVIIQPIEDIGKQAAMAIYERICNSSAPCKAVTLANVIIN